ncbi:MAG: hypothetical protein WC297_01860 [Candidatus Paceibacterota bacterium]|jgi:hypothetical protein
MADKKLDKKSGGNGGGDGSNGLVLLIVWGGIILLLFGGLKTSGFLNQIYVTNLKSDQKCQTSNPLCNVIGYAYNGEGLGSSIFHYQKTVDVYQILESSVNSNLFYAATNHGIFFSQDTGKNWYPFSDLNKKINKDTMINKMIANPASTQEMFISVSKKNQGSVYQSDNGLFTLNSLLEFNGDTANDLMIFRGNLYLGLKSGKILNYSLDAKKSRQIVKLPSSILKLSNVNNAVIYAMTAYSGVFKSTDGITFTKIQSPTNVTDIVVSQDNSVIYMTTKNGILKSSDFGNNFKKLESLPLDANKIEKVTASSANHVYVFGNHQTYESIDGGISWKAYDNKISRSISAVVVTEDRILVGTKSFNFLNLWQSLFQF